MTHTRIVHLTCARIEFFHVLWCVQQDTKTSSSLLSRRVLKRNSFVEENHENFATRKFNVLMLFVLNKLFTPRKFFLKNEKVNCISGFFFYWAQHHQTIV